MDSGLKEKPRILIVDDKPTNLISLEAAIARDDIVIIKAGSGNEALSLILEQEYAMILLDVQMPGMDGFETAELIRSNSKTSHIPIIFVSAINKEDAHIFKGYDSGAVDYLFKPVDSRILNSKIRAFIDLYLNKKESELLSQSLKKALLEAEESRKIIEEQNRLLKELAVKDGLTGLYNHRHMVVVADLEYNRAIRYKSDLSCLLMDIDFFKEVNDNLGHPFGDYVLREFAGSLKEYMRDSDLLFRYGGEEFLVLLPQTDLEGARSSAEKFRKMLENKVFTNHGVTVAITVSIGVSSLYFNHPETANELISQADKALFTAKAEGRNRVIVFHKLENAFPNAELLQNQKIRHLMESLEGILTKTKKASVASLELLVRDMGDGQTEKRNRLIKDYVTLLGFHMNLPSSVIEVFKISAVIHDCFLALLGKNVKWIEENHVMTPLEDEKNQPYILAELTEKFNFFAFEREVLLAHHECFDGSGYPEGLKGNQIPMGARIFAIVDFFVAMVFSSGDRQETNYDEALINLAKGAGTKFDPKLVARFIRVLTENEPNKISPDTHRAVQDLLEKANEPGSPLDEQGVRGVTP